MNGWIEPPVDVVDELTRWGSFGADSAAIASIGRVSRIPAPGGGGQGLTDAEKTEISVRAAVRLLLANGLIEAKIPDGEFDVILDPPEGWSS